MIPVFMKMIWSWLIFGIQVGSILFLTVLAMGVLEEVIRLFASILSAQNPCVARFIYNGTNFTSAGNGMEIGPNLSCTICFTAFIGFSAFVIVKAPVESLKSVLVFIAVVIGVFSFASISSATAAITVVSAVGAGRGQLLDDPPVSIPPAVSGSPNAPSDDLADKRKDLEIIDLVGRPGFGVVGVIFGVSCVLFANYSIPQKSSVFYSEGKRMAEILLGVMTQCVVKANIMKTMKKQDRMVTTNIALKINTKLGGVNSKAQAEQMAHRVLMDQLTLVLGIDVTHPSPMEQKAPSVASVVGNLDDTFMRYGASVRVQKHRREAMLYVQEPVRERLVEYFRYGQMESEKRQKAGQPVKENHFRDGVAEGQFQEVLREELTGIREACKQLGSDYKPKITLIVAQKRHHTRFFQMSQQAACGKAMNVRPGTVVDGGITHPE